MVGFELDPFCELIGQNIQVFVLPRSEDTIGSIISIDHVKNVEGVEKIDKTLLAFRLLVCGADIGLLSSLAVLYISQVSQWCDHGKNPIQVNNKHVMVM